MTSLRFFASLRMTILDTISICYVSDRISLFGGLVMSAVIMRITKLIGMYFLIVSGETLPQGRPTLKCRAAGWPANFSINFLSYIMTARRQAYSGAKHFALCTFKSSRDSQPLGVVVEDAQAPLLFCPDVNGLGGKDGADGGLRGADTFGGGADNGV